MLSMSEKVFVRLGKDLAAALDRYVEKRGQETPGIRLTRLGRHPRLLASESAGRAS